MNTKLPSILFKYRDDSERTEQILTSGKVWLATPGQLNDPSECKTGLIPIEWTLKNIKEMENAQMAGFLASADPALKGAESFYSLSNRDTRNWFKRFRKIKTRAKKYEAVRSFYKDHGIEISRPARLFEKLQIQLSAVGIFSLAERSDNELML